MEQPGSDIHFRLLGPVEVLRDGVSLPVGGRRQRALLSLLLLEPGRPVAAERLVEELWHGEPPSGASTTLRSYVSKLRSVLGGDAPIRHAPTGYAIDVTSDCIDARRFEELTREGHEALERGAARRGAERLRVALDLWCGRPFAGLSDDGQLRLEADRLEELRLLALEDRIDADLALGRDEDVVDELETLIQEHPYRERLWRQLMLALYRSGRQADALAAYRRARTLLDEELGLEPSAELRELEQAILRHEVPPARPPEARHNLPAPLTSFVGRETELRDIEWLLGEARLLTLTGVGGAGKTRLALEGAFRAVPEFADGVVFVDLSALGDATLVDGHVAAALDVRGETDGPVVEQVAERLRDADLLLFLDNCEHLRDACAGLVQRLLTSCPRLRVLATSRGVLGVPGEVDYAVPPLAVPPPDASLEDARSSDAVRLLLARVRTARAELRDDSALVPSAARICRDLDGLPLAIELAAARAKALSLEEISTRLGDRFRFLVSWRRLAVARHRTLEEAMDWSYDLLSADEQAVLARLSVFAGGFTLDAAAALGAGGDEERALELVGRLVDASLVLAEERNDRMRYRLLETVRQYAARRLEETGASVAARQAHVKYFAEHADRAYEALLRGALQDPFLAWFDAERDNLRAAPEYAALLGDDEAALRIVGALWRYWWVRGSLAEGRASLAKALERAKNPAPGLAARALSGAAGLAWAQGDYASARVLAAETLTVARAAGAVDEEISGHNVLGITAMNTKDFEAARSHLEASVALAEANGREIYARVGRLNLAVTFLESGDTDAAVPIFEGLLELARAEGNAEGIGFANLNLGQAAYRLGHYNAAREHFAEARTAFATIGFRAHVGHALQGLAAVEAHVGSATEAARLLGRADALLVEVGASADDFETKLAAEVEAAARAAIGDEAFDAAFAEGERSQSATV